MIGQYIIGFSLGMFLGMMVMAFLIYKFQHIIIPLLTVKKLKEVMKVETTKKEE